VQDRAAAAGELPEQRQRDHGLAGARAARDDDDALAVAGPGLLDLVEHDPDGEPLVAEQDELLLPLDLVGRGAQQLPTGCDGRGQEQVGVRGPVDRWFQPLAEELEEVAAAGAGEQLSVAVLGERVQVGDVVFHSGVVEVRRAGEGVSVAVQGPGEVRQVRAVAAHLGHGVEARAVRVAVDQHELRVALPLPGAAPLLELHDDVRRLAGAGVRPGQDDVHTLGRQRQVVLEEDLDPVQAGLHEVLREDGEAPLPAPHLCRGGSASRAVRDLLGEAQGQRPLVRERGGSPRRSAGTASRRSSPGSTKWSRAGGGVSGTRESWKPVGPRGIILGPKAPAAGERAIVGGPRPGPASEWRVVRGRTRC
jgi:hypothetical protein